MMQSPWLIWPCEHPPAIHNGLLPLASNVRSGVVGVPFPPPMLNARREPSSEYVWPLDSVNAIFTESNGVEVHGVGVQITEGAPPLAKWATTVALPPLKVRVTRVSPPAVP